MLKIFNTILFVACENSDGLMGFHYSHDGFWNGGNILQGTTTKIECANTCMGKGSCVAIFMYGAINTDCYHYINKADLVSTNEVIDVLAKAYIKCSGTDL